MQCQSRFQTNRSGCRATGRSRPGAHYLAMLVLGLVLSLWPLIVTAAPTSGDSTSEAREPSGEDSAQLLTLLREGAPQERRLALLALAERGSQDVVPEVLPVLHDADPVARELAERALWAIWSRSGDSVADSLLRRGEMFLGEGQYAKALHVFDDVIAMQPEFAEGYNKRATAFYYLGRFKRSLADIDETLARNPFHFGALSGAGLCMLGLRRFPEALDFFQRAKTVNPNLGGIDEIIEALHKKVDKPLTRKMRAPPPSTPI